VIVLFCTFFANSLVITKLLMDKKRLYILGEMPVRKAIITLALPTVVSMLVQVFYNITDTFFIGKLNDPYQLAAVSICMPLFMMLVSISGIFGNGGASYLSRQLGKKDYEGARETSTVTIVFCFATSLLVAIIGLIFIKPILHLAGASATSMPYATSYLSIILGGSSILMLNFTIAMLLRAEGSAKAVMKGNLLGTVVNIALDPVFIFLLDMGVAGAGIATIIGAGCSLLYLLSFYFRRNSLAMPSLRYLKPRWVTFREIFKIGIPASLSQIMMSIGNSISFGVAAGYGDVAVAAFGVVWRVMSLPVFVMIGLSIGLQPLVGYSYGANNHRRLKKSVRTALAISGFLAAFFLALFLLFPRALIAVFISDREVVEMGSKVLTAFTIAIPFIALQMPLMTSIQAMGKGLPSLIIALSRNGLVYIPAVYILNSLFGFDGLVFALPLSDVISALLALLLFAGIYRKLKHHPAEPEIMEHVLEDTVS
jgi:multidrug efflux pump